MTCEVYRKNFGQESKVTVMLKAALVSVQCDITC